MLQRHQAAEKANAEVLPNRILCKYKNRPRGSRIIWKVCSIGENMEGVYDVRVTVGISHAQGTIIRDNERCLLGEQRSCSRKHMQALKTREAGVQAKVRPRTVQVGNGL